MTIDLYIVEIFNFSTFGEKTSYRSLSYKKFHKRQNYRQGLDIFWYIFEIIEYQLKLKSQDPKRQF